MTCLEHCQPGPGHSYAQDRSMSVKALFAKGTAIPTSPLSHFSWLTTSLLSAALWSNLQPTGWFLPKGWYNQHCWLGLSVIISHQSRQMSPNVLRSMKCHLPFGGSDGSGLTSPGAALQRLAGPRWHFRMRPLETLQKWSSTHCTERAGSAWVRLPPLFSL